MSEYLAYQDYLNNPNNAVNLAFVNIHDVVNLVSPRNVKPSYASVLKRGTNSTPPNQVLYRAL